MCFSFVISGGRLSENLLGTTDNGGSSDISSDKFKISDEPKIIPNSNKKILIHIVVDFRMTKKSVMKIK